MSRCIIIPALKKNAVIPDQLVKKMSGIPLIQRALNTAKKIESPENIIVVTDSDEIRLICERNGVGCNYDPTYTIDSLNIVPSLRPLLKEVPRGCESLIIYRSSSPLITAEDIEDAYSFFVQKGSDALVTVKSVKYRLWRETSSTLATLLSDEDTDSAYAETKAFVMLRSSILLEKLNKETQRICITPYYLNDRGIEINSYQDWWICEKILQSKHIVFVVAGYPAIGMGHIYRALMLAHEIADHRITFLCTKESELAALNIASKDYRTKIQRSEKLETDVLMLKPDLVINDILNTSKEYMNALKSAVPTVNFEDEGEGACLADLIVNALYEGHRHSDQKYLYGHNNFCLRDEFILATPNPFRSKPENILITFGGTDHDDFTGSTLETIWAECVRQGINISIVTGPGYAHKERLNKRIEWLNDNDGAISITFTHATNIMSKIMEKVDFAICSAGRTVYELTHMRIPAIVMAHHLREDMHSFARSQNGFEYIGVMNPFKKQALLESFERMLDSAYRKELYMRMRSFDFSLNKTNVMRRVLSLLHTQEK